MVSVMPVSNDVLFSSMVCSLSRLNIDEVAYGCVKW